jgi:hypothetical protein
MIDAENAKRISRGRVIALSYTAMTRQNFDEDGIETVAADCIADLLHAVLNEPFDRAAQDEEWKIAFAESVVEAALRHFTAELRGED